MNRYLFVPKTLQWLEAGTTFRMVVATLLRLAAVAVVLTALLGWIDGWKRLEGQDAQVIVGLVLFQVVSLVGFYAITHTIVIRSGSVSSLPDGDFMVLRIMAVVLRTAGECLAWFFATLTLSGFVLALFVGDAATYLLRSTFSYGDSLALRSGFFGVVLFVALGLTMAFASLLVCYVLAESSMVGVSIARDASAIRRVAENPAAAPATAGE